MVSKIIGPSEVAITTFPDNGVERSQPDAQKINSLAIQIKITSVTKMIFAAIGVGFMAMVTSFYGTPIGLVWLLILLYHAHTMLFILTMLLLLVSAVGFFASHTVQKNKEEELVQMNSISKKNEIPQQVKDSPN